jgi:hypothetical protein
MTPTRANLADYGLVIAVVVVVLERLASGVRG